MRTLDIILLLVGAISFAVEIILSLQPARRTTLNFVALGLLAWILVPLITLIRN
jgi:hypothetical protein